GGGDLSIRPEPAPGDDPGTCGRRKHSNRFKCDELGIPEVAALDQGLGYPNDQSQRYRKDHTSRRRGDKITEWLEATAPAAEPVVHRGAAVRLTSRFPRLP